MSTYVPVEVRVLGWSLEGLRGSCQRRMLSESLCTSDTSQILKRKLMTEQFLKSLTVCSTKKEHFFDIRNGEASTLAYRYVQCTALYLKSAGRYIIYIYIKCIYHVRSKEQFDIAHVGLRIACMPGARPWLVTRWRRDRKGHKGTHGAPGLSPECHLQSNILSFVTSCGQVNHFCAHVQCLEGSFRNLGGFGGTYSGQGHLNTKRIQFGEPTP